MAAKILVIGATNGHFIEAFAKVTALHTKNNFSLALLIGDLFSAPTSLTSPTDDETVQQLLRGEIKVPLPTYFGLGKNSLPTSVREKIASSGEVCENLFFLGKKTVLNTSEGIRIVALGGRLDPNIVTGGKPEESEADELPFYSAQDAKGLKGANTADILLTYEWPEDIAKNSALPGALEGNSTIAELAAAIRPRYHFASAGATFWEREPYRNSMKGGEGQGDLRITRFLGVGDWGNEAKAKSLYAFSIKPKDTTPATVPVNATGCPYRFDRGKKRTAGEADGGGSFFWGEHIRDERGGKRGRGGHGKGRGREARPPPGPENCFFCLSYPQLEKHLIVSIGNEAYLTTAKGPLTNPAHNPPTLPFSSHILIIPLTHTPTLSLIDDIESKDNTLKEMTMYKESLEKMLKPRGCGAVTFEVSRAGGVHGHWQVVPVPLEKLGEVEAAFKAEAEGDKLQGFEKREVTEDDGDFFRVWVSGEDEALVCPLRDGEYFDLQFGRRVLAKVLGLKTVHWKDCVLSLEEETKDAGKFKEAFKEFDFSL